jgi:hypothetical protein
MSYEFCECIGLVLISNSKPRKAHCLSGFFIGVNENKFKEFKKFKTSKETKHLKNLKI